MRELLGAEQGRENLRRAAELATPADRHAGKAAYGIYRDVLKDFADFYGVGLVPAVEVFVALSPNNDYHGNLRSMASVLYAHQTGADPESAVVTCFGAAKRRATSYVKGTVNFLDSVKGQKITSFRHNILYPTSTKPVATIDGHMIAVWQGDDTLTMKEAARVLKGSRGNYELLERGVADAAAQAKLLPCQMQAVLWFARKRATATKYSAQLELFSEAGDVSRTRVSPRDYPPYGASIRDAWINQTERYYYGK